MSRSFTTTTPIYYVNSVPHIGTALTTFASDVVSRYQKMRGMRVHYMTGTDENGIKVMEAAEKAGETPQAFVDRIAKEFEVTWRGMKIDYDDFLRTTQPRHHEAVYELFRLLKENGYVYLGKYEGWYDVSTETFYKEADLVDGKSPDGHPVQWVEEENWFFKLSAFGDQLKNHIQSNSSFIVPDVRKNEVLAFIDQGLRDVCISRTGQKWGIPIPGDQARVFYVWFEALVCYLATAGFPYEGWKDKWPADVQWMGKDILTRFHATLWPAMLMGAGLPLPKTLIGHGWILMGGQKVSKSKGNVVAPLKLAADVAEITDCGMDLAVDAVRHYMGSIMPYESDYTFTYEDFGKRYNSDLANDFGNALNRSLVMVQRFAGNVIPEGDIEPEALEAVKRSKELYEESMGRYRIDLAVDASMQLVRFLNKYIDTCAPWALAKNNDPRVKSVLKSMIFVLRAVEGLVKSVIPAASEQVALQLGMSPIQHWDEIGATDALRSGHVLGQPKPMYPRMNQDCMTAFWETGIHSQPAEKVQVAAEVLTVQENLIDFDLFKKVEMKVGRVVHAEEVPKSKKLLRLEVQIGQERRQIVSGIREAYAPADVLEKLVVVVTNLKPAKLMGIESQGMILAAVGDDGKPVLVAPSSVVPSGTSVS
jgi:methionyl-tRNA synthetase